MVNPRSLARKVIRILGAVAALLFAAALSPAGAVSVGPGDILPDAVSYQYIRLPPSNHVMTRDTLGSIVYGPVCTGFCLTTAWLGKTPAIAADIKQGTGSGSGLVEVHLGYYVAYLNAPGDYTVNLHALGGLSAPDGSAVSAHVKFGLAGGAPGSFNDFASTAFEAAACLNGCPAPGFSIPTAPFADDNLVTMTANTLYFMQLDLMMNPLSSGVLSRVVVDPTFLTSATGGKFVFSLLPTPIPATLPLFASALGGLGFVGWRRRSSALALPRAALPRHGSQRWRQCGCEG